MSNLAKEVADELDARVPNMSWVQKASLIVAANVFGLVLGAIVIAAGNMVWNKAMSTDHIRAEMARGDKLAEAERAAILEELANLGAAHSKFQQLVRGLHAEDHGAEEGRTGPAYAPEAPPNPWRDMMEGNKTPEPPPPVAQKAIVVGPSADDLKDARERIQESIDKKVYRAMQRD